MELTLEVPAPSRPPGATAEEHPVDRVVFSGEWLMYDGPDGVRFQSGYAGRLIDRWNGWAVWECTREVAAAVVTDNEIARRHTRGLLQAQGMQEPALSRALDADVCEMSWDGDVIVVDRRAFGEDAQFLRIGPNERGLYVVMGQIWTWDDVPISLVDTVHGAD
ncbi:hypothetical protein ACQEVC_34475 [Plantactinospora sp. CA-294935]|uniref:hypothetical protein n=1 Tax=Plantactinospora sp. CA-294935 TaxID=3240012 RepID=UPI003D8D7F85